MPLHADADIVLAKVSTVRTCLATVRRLTARDAPRLESWIVRDLDAIVAKHLTDLDRFVDAILDATGQR